MLECEFKKIQIHQHILVMICNCSHNLDLLCCAWVANLAQDSRESFQDTKSWKNESVYVCVCSRNLTFD